MKDKPRETDRRRRFSAIGCNTPISLLAIMIENERGVVVHGRAYLRLDINETR